MRLFLYAEMKEIAVHSDGSCNNKKQEEGGGIGIHMNYNGHIHEVSEGYEGPTTSAQMEIMGAIRTLELLKPGYQITIFIDNKYVVDTIEQGWLNGWIKKGILETKANHLLWRRFREAYEKHGGYLNVRLQWIKGHAGHKENERVDELANQGRLSENKFPRPVEFGEV